eukprot:SAG31_NODE_810_length_11919_cov_4.480924_8_plen_136_part_00
MFSSAMKRETARISGSLYGEGPMYADEHGFLDACSSPHSKPLQIRRIERVKLPGSMCADAMLFSSAHQFRFVSTPLQLSHSVGLQFGKHASKHSASATSLAGCICRLLRQLRAAGSDHECTKPSTCQRKQYCNDY